MRLIDADALIERLRKARLIFDKNEARFESLGIGYAIEIIEQETPTISQWIPCNKCDVPKYKHFLGTDKDGRIYECYWAERNDYKGIYISHVGYAFDSIIAWMPLPEAYKERSE